MATPTSFSFSPSSKTRPQAGSLKEEGQRDGQLTHILAELKEIKEELTSIKSMIKSLSDVKNARSHTFSGPTTRSGVSYFKD